MSQQNHPNFHSVNFAAEITKSFYESIQLREQIRLEDFPEFSSEKIKKLILKFTEECELIVDEAVEKNLKKITDKPYTDDIILFAKSTFSRI